MQVLVIDDNAEAQTLVARKIYSLDAADRNALGLDVFLAGPANFDSRVSQANVALLGTAQYWYRRAGAVPFEGTQAEELAVLKLKFRTKEQSS